MSSKRRPPPPPPDTAAYLAQPSQVTSENTPCGDANRGIVRVKVLGPLDIEGLREDTASSPVRELLVFLATHPGTAFTSVGLRSAIWVEGRAQPTSGTFRNYLSELRKALPEGALVRDGTTSRLTEAVSSDWMLFETALGDRGDRALRLERALALVRGVPLAGALEGRNAPYAWASQLLHRIEASVESAGHELAALCLASGDVGLADWAVDQALLAVPSSLVLHEDRLRVGAALGGPREVERRLAAAAATLGEDARHLEAAARALLVQAAE